MMWSILISVKCRGNADSYQEYIPQHPGGNLIRDIERSVSGACR